MSWQQGPVEAHISQGWWGRQDGLWGPGITHSTASARNTGRDRVYTVTVSGASPSPSTHGGARRRGGYLSDIALANTCEKGKSNNYDYKCIANIISGIY